MKLLLVCILARATYKMAIRHLNTAPFKLKIIELAENTSNVLRRDSSAFARRD